MNKPLIIGLTGNIATGKSTVMQMLAARGAYTIDADKLVHRLLANDRELRDSVIGRFGNDVLGPDGAISRAGLAEIVFKNTSALMDLESIIHPRVGQEVDRLIQSANSRWIVIEAIKLLESDLRKKCHMIWVTTCREKQQIDRMMRQRGMTEIQAKARIASQPPQESKISKADVIIDTGGSLQATENLVDQAWVKIDTDQEKRATEPVDVSVRRAGPRDVKALARFLNRMNYLPHPLDTNHLLATFGEKGYLIAQRGNEIVGALAWNTENFLAFIHQLYSFRSQGQVEQALLATVFQSAKELKCEAIIFRPTDQNGDQVVGILQKLGYEKKMGDDLSLTWRRVISTTWPSVKMFWIFKI